MTPTPDIEVLIAAWKAGIEGLTFFMDPNGRVTIPQGTRVKDLINALPPAPVGAPVLPLLAIRPSNITALIDAYEAVKAERDEYKSGWTRCRGYFEDKCKDLNATVARAEAAEAKVAELTAQAARIDQLLTHTFMEIPVPEGGTRKRAWQSLIDARDLARRAALAGKEEG